MVWAHAPNSVAVAEFAITESWQTAGVVLAGLARPHCP